MIIQGSLAQLKDVLPVIAALHPVNGLAVLYVAYGLARAPRPNVEAVAAVQQIAAAPVAH